MNNERHINCCDIYEDVLDKYSKSLIRFRNAWRKHKWKDMDLFQYTSTDFYFYRYTIDRLEKSTGELLNEILCRMLERYDVQYEKLERTIFSFVLFEDDKKIGYICRDSLIDNEVLNTYNIDEARIILTLNEEYGYHAVERDNGFFEDKGIRCRYIIVAEFFNMYFDSREYESFCKYIKKYTCITNDIVGFKPISFLSSMNLANQRIHEEKILLDMKYVDYKYHHLNGGEIGDHISDIAKKKMIDNYVGKKLYYSMLGNNEYAKSFITSEWLYYSLKEKKNFDYTAVISGYLKSIEQLLETIAKVNIDNNCIIEIHSKKLKKAYTNNIKVYDKYRRERCLNINDKGWVVCDTDHPYIDYTSEQNEYKNSSIGVYEYFLRVNNHIFVEPNTSNCIADLISCFRDECRNEFFHIHNLNDWNVVEKVRLNAIYLYFVLLGGIVIPDNKMSELGIIKKDKFDELCGIINEFVNYSPEFIFEYESGQKENVIYDILNNTSGFSDNGIEHYDSLCFFVVDEFSIESYVKLDNGILDEQRIYLTREDIPDRIYSVSNKGELREIYS